MLWICLICLDFPESLTFFREATYVKICLIYEDNDPIIAEYNSSLLPFISDKTF
jgi:hypothetical protein